MNRRDFPPSARLLPALIASLIMLDGVSRAADENDDFFETRIRPVLVQHCYECHASGAAEAEGGLVLDHRDGLRQGGDSGPAVVPGEPAESLLLQALHYESLEMPPAGKLPATVIADFETWIRKGAADPRDRPHSPVEAAEAAWSEQLSERRQWWSLQSPHDSAPTEIDDADWSQEPVDAFILAGLQDAGLSPAPPADAQTLIRRLSFVLTGLPPRPGQVVAFRKDFASDPDAAVTRSVDQLLHSPHFGERFARHWMDVVRYTDTYGYEWDNPAKGSWEYRDYLIRAFNGDVGFDQLIREQIAGDLLPQPRIDPASGTNESLVGPMFYHMGEHRHGTSLDFNGIHQEMIDNKIDAFSKAFLGMTVACARCHDHKLDAISQADYYALAGVFMTPRWTARDIDAADKHGAAIGEMKRLRAEIRDAMARVWTASGASELRKAAALRTWAHERRAMLTAAPLEDVAHPLAQWLDNENGSPPEADLWQRLAAEWTEQRQTRQKANQEGFTVVSDFAMPGFPEGWTVDGLGLEHGYVEDGTLLVALQNDALIQSFLPRGYHTHALSSKLAGAIRLPRAEKFPGRFVSLQLAGGEWAGRIDVPQNAFQAEGVSFFDPASPPTWQTATATPLKNGVTRVLTEFATASLNPNFPPRTGLATSGGKKLPDEDDGHDKRSWFSLTGIVAHEAGGTPVDTLDAFIPLYDASAPASVDDAWQRLADWLDGSVQRWAAGQTQAGDVHILNWLLEHELLPNDPASMPEVASLVERYRTVESQINFARSAISMDERGVEPVDYRLNIRGDVDNEGPAISRDFLHVFAEQHRVGDSDGSGRRELAEYLASRDNPQTARVYVNRLWQWIFGTGLVGTPNDFGKLGDRPSNPELLDWLAIRFMEEGWSTKQLVRRLVLSRTFRQSGSVDSLAAERDPGNRLLHHYPTRRLQAEAIRDSLLAVSGRLDPQRYGRPINPPRVAEDATKRLFSGPWDSHGRRSIYITMSIMAPPKFLVGFNLPDLKLPTGRRDQTNVPAQALIMLNDPLVTGLADHWAARLMTDGRTDVEERVRAMFFEALGREPTDEECNRWVEATSTFASPGADRMSDQKMWADIAHGLFNTKEFIYYR